MRKSAIRHEERRQRKFRTLAIDTVAVKLKARVIEDEIDAAALALAGDPVGLVDIGVDVADLVLEFLDELPELLKVIAEDVLLGLGEVVAAGALQALDLLLRHVDQEREVGRVAPQADWIKLGQPRRQRGVNWHELCVSS